MGVSQELEYIDNFPRWSVLMHHNHFSDTFSELCGSTFTSTCHVSSEDMTKDGNSFTHFRKAQITPTWGDMKTFVRKTVSSYLIV